MQSNNYIAIDLGATSGRVIVFNGDKLDEVYRFKDYLKHENNRFTWDIDALFSDIKKGLKLAVEKYHYIESLSIDTWGCDYVLLKNKEVIKPVYAYRDNRSLKAMDNTFKIISQEELYKITGSQISPVNSLYQFKDDLDNGRLNEATDFLYIPEYFTYLLTGIMSHEQSIASTSGMLDLKSGEYSQEIIKRLNFPAHLFRPLKRPGYVVGRLKEDIQKEIGADMKVVMCASHDTAAALYAVDAPSDAVIISSGTWSLIGVKLKEDEGVNSKESLDAGLTNETSVGFLCYLRNLMGLWIFNEVHRKRSESYDEINELSFASTYNEIFNIMDPTLLAPDDMLIAIKNLLKHNPPKNIGDVYRSIFRSLATAYRDATNLFEKILNKSFKQIYIVGGGAKNLALNKFTEEISGRKVVAMPIEATALGNLKSQKVN